MQPVKLAILPRAPFRLEIDRKTSAFGLDDRFIRDHGPDILCELLQSAGLDYGHWTFRVMEKFRAAAQTPPLQVRRPDINGVHLWVRPADRGSAIKGILIVTRDRELTVQQVYERLKEACHKSNLDGEPPVASEAPFVPLELDETDALLLLDAIHNCNGASDSISAFIARMAHTLDSEEPNVSYWLETAEALVERGWLVDQKTRYTLTAEGQAALAREISPAVPASAPEAPLGNSCKSTAGQEVREIGDVLLKSKDRLSSLLQVISKVTASRERQQTLGNKVADLKKQLAAAQAELAEEQGREAAATQGVPVMALMELLDQPGAAHVDNGKA